MIAIGLAAIALSTTGCGDSAVVTTVTAQAETVTVGATDTTDYSSDGTDYTDTTTDYSSDGSDPYATASSTYSDYIDRFNNDSTAMQISQSLVMTAKQIPAGDGTVYCRIGMSTQYAGSVIIDLYLPIGTGMAFMVPSSGSPVIQGDITTAPSQGDPCSVSNDGQVSF